ncbi:MAG: methyltransferase domain-containing protein [Bryobacterales bacterium]|nr:methyltransferase domain-containing protein [Bryobacterales bacterium]
MSDAIVAISASMGAHAHATAEPLAGTCPACNSPDFESILRTGDRGESRTLIACGRCSLLRFLGGSTASRAATYQDALHYSAAGRCLADRLFRFLRRVGLQTKLRFVGSALFRKGSDGVVLDCSGGDGSVARALEREDARSLAVLRSCGEAIESLHRQGIHAVVADPADPPIRVPMFDVVCRLRGFAHDEDPVMWLQSSRKLLRPGGRIVIQAFDSASWAFLITGSQWAALEGTCARYAFRAVDLEVLLDFSGYRIRRRTHFFPLLNASVWVSSLFPSLDPQRRREKAENRPTETLTLALDLVYAALLAAAIPLALVESVCHAGSVLMVEAEPK